MRTYSVFEPPIQPGVPGAASVERRADGYVFVRHGWSLAALVLPIVWMLVRRLWWVLLVYVVASIALQVLSLAASPIVSVALAIALALMVMTEAGQLKLESMAAKGYAEVAVIQADNQTEAERQFFGHWLKEQSLSMEAPSQERTLRPAVLRPQSTTPPALPGLPSR
ncbi:MAG: DUF2628 domain-containing protein [Pseudomonadota bacterium]